MNSTSESKVSKADLAQMMVGAVAMAFPVALAEESWDLGEQQVNWRVFALRIGTVYLLTAVVAGAILAVFGKWPIVSDTHVAIGRTIIVAFPAMFSAMIVDSLH